MAKFEYEYNGYIYEIDAEDEKSADDKFNKTIADFPTPEDQEKTKKHQGQNKKWKEGIDKAQGPWQKTDAYLNAVFGRANRTLREAPLGLDAMEKKINPSLIKGVPVAGRYVPQTEELSKFEEEHPYTSKGLQIAGGTAATLPIFGGASKVMGPGFGRQFMGQFGAAAPMNVADTLARKDKETTATDISKDILMAAGTSILPAAVTKGLGQSSRAATPNISDFMRPGGHTLPSGAPIPPPWAIQRGTNIAPSYGGSIPQRTLDAASALAGGALGYGHSIEGAILGTLLAPQASRLVGEPIIRGMQHPSTQDIIRSLMAQVPSQMQDPTQPQP